MEEAKKETEGKDKLIQEEKAEAGKVRQRAKTNSYRRKRQRLER